MSAFRSSAEAWLVVHGVVSLPTLPDFLGIGAQKAGTTWLHENLRRHPQLYLPPQKELHFFDENYHRGLRWYADAFREGAARRRGEITPAYGILPAERIRLIHDLMPELRLVMLLRNPIERAWSQALMNLVQLPRRRYEEVSDDEFLAHFTSDRSLRRGDYASILDNWLRVFPKERLFIGFFEELREQPRELLKRIMAHVRVDSPVSWAGFPVEEVFYAGLSIPLPARLGTRLRELYAAELEKLQERLGPPVAAWRA